MVKHRYRSELFLLHKHLAVLKIQLLLSLETHLFLETTSFGLFFLQKLLVVVFLERKFFFLHIGVSVDHWLLPFEPILGLPGWIVDLTVHESLFLHLADDIVNFLCVAQGINNSLMFSHVFIDKIQTSSDYFQLVDYSFQLKRHHFRYFLNKKRITLDFWLWTGNFCFSCFSWPLF